MSSTRSPKLGLGRDLDLDGKPNCLACPFRDEERNPGTEWLTHYAYFLRGAIANEAIERKRLLRHRVAKARAETPAFAIWQPARRKGEALFAELKNYIGLRRLRLRRMRFVREQCYLAAKAQNLKRLVRFLRRKSTVEHGNCMKLAWRNERSE